MFAAPIFSAFVLAGAGNAGAPAYPRPDLLIEPRVLAKQAEGFRILDVRPKAKYLAGHLPHATWVDHDAWNKAFTAKQDAAAWEQTIGRLGIGDDTKVVLYDDALSKEAARVWWILRYWGVKDARLVNGGWVGLMKENLPVVTETDETTPKPFKIANPQAARLATKESVLGLLNDKKMQIIDTRSEKEYCGDTKLAKRGGAIPSAMHLEWTQALDAQTQRFKTVDELRKIFKQAGIDPAQPSVTYCQSGGRAAVMAFTLELMGNRDVANYYRSWSEWGNAADTPIELPKK
jgi:thiosulfate/3-mercaptopyruvate sulfurtransferase